MSDNKSIKVSRSKSSMKLEIASWELNFLVWDVVKAVKEGKEITMTCNDDIFEIHIKE